MIANIFDNIEILNAKYSLRYTGWCDVPLTANGWFAILNYNWCKNFPNAGEADAADAGQLMKDRGLHFDIAFTSVKRLLSHVDKQWILFYFI